MPTVEEVTLWGHIAAGVVAVLAGAVALATTKGGRRHRAAGRAFVRSMAVVVASTLALYALAPTSFRAFLVLVAVFSGYLAFSGYRVLSRKRPSATPTRGDWLALGGVLAACGALAGWGGYRLAGGETFGAVLVVFGGIGLAIGAVDLRRFRGASERGAWTVTHLQRMLAAFVATVSAVSAVNLTPTLGVLAWLWPTVVGTPLIAYWSRKYER